MATSSTIPPRPPSVSSLAQGDHLTRAEFEQRYEAMPHLNKAELIEGVVHMPSPVRWSEHSVPHAALITWLGCYWASTPGVQVGANGTIRLDMDNEPQPDAAMIIDPPRGGSVKLSEDKYIVGAPELVAEVAASTVSIDLHAKLRAYRRNNVCEYLAWRVEDQTIDWFVLHTNQYERLMPDANGAYRSEVFPGLWLDQSALVRCDLAAVLQTLQLGLASPEHAAFVMKLQEATNPPVP